MALSEADFQPSQLESTRGLVQRLRLPAGKSPVGQIANPANSTHYNYLQMLALSVPGEEIAPTTDGTLPDSAWLSGASADADAFRAQLAARGDPDVRHLQTLGAGGGAGRFAYTVVMDKDQQSKKGAGGKGAGGNSQTW